MLVPPDNFGLVEPGIYRCSKLESDHFPFLETLKLKSLIVLDAEKPPRLLKTFLESNNVNLYNLGGLKISNHHHTGASSNMGKDEDDYLEDDRGSVNSSRRVSANDIELIKLDDTTTGVGSGEKKRNDLWMLIEKNLIHRAFELLLNKNKHNVLLVDSTLTLVGILRKIQKWNFNSIVNEYRIYTGPSNKSNYYAENFLELVQTELIPYEVEQVNKRQQQQQQQQQQQPQNLESILPRLNATLPRLMAVNFRTNSHEILKESPAIGINNNNNNNSSGIPILYEPTFTDLDDDVDVDEDDELTDDDLLSASPQIPANLLKLVEKRKLEKASRSNLNDEDSGDKISGRRRITPGSSPKHHPMLKRNSISNDLFFSSAMGSRRRSSVDVKLRPLTNSNHKFRTPSLASIESPGHNQHQTHTHSTVQSPLQTSSSLSTSFPGVRRLSRTKESSETITAVEIQRIKDKFEYKYYKNLHKNRVKYENVNVIKIKLPPDEKLPNWFIKNRDSWELRFKMMNHTI